MRLVIFGMLSLVAGAVPAVAEETCIEVEIGGEKAPNVACLNRLLVDQVESMRRPQDNMAPLDTGSAPPRLGGYNEPALRQQYGPNYGKSAVPWRPTTTYSRGASR